METNGEKLLSVIIPVYQAKDTLRECVLSCLNQKDLNPEEIEIILSDDGSTDGSKELCDDLQKEYGQERITVIHTGNHGVSHARNLGLERATGHFVTFVDADDNLTEDFAENLMKYADETTVLLDETDSLQSGVKVSGYQYIENSILNANSHVWGKIFEKKELEQSGTRFIEGLTIGEDLLFLIDFALAQGKTHNIKCIRGSGNYVYKENENGAMKSAFKASYMDELKCWSLAGDKMMAARENFSSYAFVTLAVNRIMTAFLVIGKVAVQDEQDRDNDLSALAISKASEQINDALKTHGSFAGLSLGYKLKVILFKISPKLYINSYHRHKRGK
ncbi:glycosyltransferase family 2 protein [Butyrivibrio sp. FCS014]|uniref:glycosyltransferase family 2 protein n=1 Tax=Butyrivibrio sp. FCS014 TaxID=1408304 RepID=UPI000464DFDD|nr:glycosyltransferase family 2 protein [Butyrivibrio sp. FCS014]